MGQQCKFQYKLQGILFLQVAATKEDQLWVVGRA